MTAASLSNPFAQPETLYVWAIHSSGIDDFLLDLIAEMEGVLSVSTDILDGKQLIMAYTDRPENQQTHSSLAAIAAATHHQLNLLSCETVEPKDWVSETQAAIKPLKINRFIVIGSHHTIADVPHGLIPVHMDAGAAFGTGEHATTSGCLEAIAYVNKRTSIRHALDMGCGTAILAIAQAKLSPATVLAVDNDAVAVRVACENIRRNRVANQITAIVSEGFKHPTVKQTAPYDLVIANILARPVRQMAGNIAFHLQAGGYVILSGFYDRDIPFVLSRYREYGFALEKKYIHHHWAALVLRKPQMPYERI